MLNTNEIFGGTYQIIKEIGRGGAGVVYPPFAKICSSEADPDEISGFSAMACGN